MHGLTWTIGGPQGSGVDSAAQLYALSVARAGLHAFGQREYYSNIMGKHSYYKVRSSDRPLHGPDAQVHLLAAYDEETVARHVHGRELVEGSAILYPVGLEDKKVMDLQLISSHARQAIVDELARSGLEPTMGGSLEWARRHGILVLPVPYDELLQDAAEELGIEAKTIQIVRNTIAVGASLGLLGLDPSYVEDTVRTIFQGKSAKVHEANIVAARVGSRYARRELPHFEYRLPPPQDPEGRIWIQGTQAVALAKILAGCRYHSYYPISPSTDEATFLEAHPQSGVVVHQTEDEIAAVASAIGAALTGARASTSTSGPGLCLMVEALGWAGMCEVPLVVFDYMRGGPSTGLPTRNEQGDLQFALRLGHSDFPRIVVAPGDIDELFEDACDAFDWAERYQTPVIVLADRALAGNSRTVQPFATNRTIDRGAIAASSAGKDGTFPRFDFAEDGVSHRALLGQEGLIHWLTGDEHTPDGHITEDAVTRDRMMEKRLRKLMKAAKEIPDERRWTLHGPSDADVTVVSWGSTKGAVLEAIERLEADGLRVNFLQVRIMSPFPDAIAPVLRQARELVVVEENATGQLRDLIAERTGIMVQRVVTKTNGRPTMPSELVEALGKALPTEPARVVMQHGV